MSAPNLSNSMLARLQRIAVLQAMEPDEVATLVALMTLRSARAGETIVREGEPGDEMFILLSGRVRICKHTVDDEEYTVALQDAQDTPVFGELALLDEDRRSATIHAAEASELLVLSRERFERFGNEHPRAGLLMTRQLARRVSANLRRSNDDSVLLFAALVNEVRTKTTV